ncbi:MAG: YaiO family outer membrane beta-barrel protein, partial [Firmicutes bacterium]|nr:YaiO family outer membrane beta-barrel protein [Bacillota bacterium]
ALVLAGQEAEHAPKVRIGLGGYTDQFSDATGTWKGWTANVEWFRDSSGPWSLALATSQRPEGRGTLATLGEETAFGDWSWIWVSVGSGSGDNFLPSFRGNLDMSLGINEAWSLELGGFYNRFRDGSSTTILQAGPGWKGKVWSSTLRLQQVKYDPGGDSNLGVLFDLRWGADNFRRWHSLRLGWGEGVLDALQTGGSLSVTTSTFYGGGGGGGRGWGGGTGGTGTTGTTGTTVTTTQWVYPSAKEALVGFSSHLPFNDHFALRLDVSWGQRQGYFTVWSGAIQTVVTF